MCSRYRNSARSTWPVRCVWSAVLGRLPHPTARSCQSEFVKIVDSHSPLLPTPTEPAVEAIDSKPEGGEPSVAAGEADQAAHNDGEDPEAVLERSRALWEHEWKLLDTHRRGRVSLQELTRFLATCALILPAADLQRFLECYGEADAGENGNEDAEDALLLTKAGFLRFRYDFTAKDLVPADDGLSSSEADEDDDGAAFFDAGEQQPTDRPEDAEAMRQVARPLSAGAGPSGRRSDLDALSARHEHLAVDPSLFQGSEYDSEGDEGESEASARGMGLDLDAGALGPMGAG
jgi:hypothetical protein